MYRSDKENNVVVCFIMKVCIQHRSERSPEAKRVRRLLNWLHRYRWWVRWLRPQQRCQAVTWAAINHKVNVKVQVFYSLISSLKPYHRTLHLTPWSLDLFIHVPFQLPGEHTVLQPFRRIELIVHIVISVLPGTQVKWSIWGWSVLPKDTPS